MFFLTLENLVMRYNVGTDYCLILILLGETFMSH